MDPRRRVISNLRWWIGLMLFASTVINYIDRQTVNVLGPYLKSEYRWNNQDFALVVVAFRIAYAIGPTFAGRFLDRVGVRRGLSITVLWYSAAAMLTSFASGLRSLCTFRFLLGLGESANWPGATKTVAELFPDRERGLAVALFDSGSAVGAAVAPFLVVWLYHGFGSWRPAFAITGGLGLLWVIVWQSVNRNAEQTKTEVPDHPQQPWTNLLRLPQTWGIILGKALTDPVWYFISDWFAIYLVSKGVKLEQGLLAFWIPFVAADVGNFAGGGASSWLITRGHSVLYARKAVILAGGVGMTLLIPTIWVSNVFALAGLFAVTTFCYAAWSTMDIVLPSDLYPSTAVATVSGMSSTAAGLGTIASTLSIGYVADHYSFGPILLAASLVPLAATAVIFALVRNPIS